MGRLIASAITPFAPRNYMHLAYHIGYRVRWYVEWEEAGRPIDYAKMFIAVEPLDRPDRLDPWHNVARAEDLAAAIHDAALGKYPDSTYAKLY